MFLRWWRARRKSQAKQKESQEFPTEFLRLIHQLRSKLKVRWAGGFVYDQEGLDLERLARENSLETIDPLGEWAKAPDSELRRVAVYCLGRISKYHPSGLEVLKRDCLVDVDLAVRQDAAAWLAKLGDISGLHVIIAQATTETPQSGSVSVYEKAKESVEGAKDMLQSLLQKEKEIAIDSASLQTLARLPDWKVQVRVYDNQMPLIGNVVEMQVDFAQVRELASQHLKKATVKFPSVRVI
jgi:HEAT repeat protein